MGSIISSQKFIVRNWVLCVQIEYDVELYGVEKKVQLFFVMGVMVDFVGKFVEFQVVVVDCKFLEIDVDNFDVWLKVMKLWVVFNVLNVLIGEGNLSLDIIFESMDDFSFVVVVCKVDLLNKLFEVCIQLVNLLIYMDGKIGVEEMIMKVIKDLVLFQVLVSVLKFKDDELQV